MTEFEDLITVIAIALILIVSLGFTPAYIFERAQCSAKAEAQGYDYEYGIFKGCMVKTEKGWMDYERLIYKKEVE